MSKTEDEQIADFIQLRGVTKCPTVLPAEFLGYNMPEDELNKLVATIRDQLRRWGSNPEKRAQGRRLGLTGTGGAAFAAAKKAGTLRTRR